MSSAGITEDRSCLAFMWALVIKVGWSCSHGKHITTEPLSQWMQCGGIVATYNDFLKCAGQSCQQRIALPWCPALFPKGKGNKLSLNKQKQHPTPNLISPDRKTKVIIAAKWSRIWQACLLRLSTDSPLLFRKDAGFTSEQANITIVKSKEYQLAWILWNSMEMRVEGLHRLYSCNPGLFLKRFIYTKENIQMTKMATLLEHNMGAHILAQKKGKQL